MNLGRTNAKQILNGLKLSQSNAYAIGRACRFLSLTDCYWVKEESENLQWDDVNLYTDSLSKVVASTALLGTPLNIKSVPNKIHTPEFKCTL